jgi:hypothetical protein
MTFPASLAKRQVVTRIIQVDLSYDFILLRSFKVHLYIMNDERIKMLEEMNRSITRKLD